MAQQLRFIIDATICLSMVGDLGDALVKDIKELGGRDPYAHFQVWEKGGHRWFRAVFTWRGETFYQVLSILGERMSVWAGRFPPATVQLAVRDTRFDVLDSVPPPRGPIYAEDRVRPKRGPHH